MFSYLPKKKKGKKLPHLDAASSDRADPVFPDRAKAVDRAMTMMAEHRWPEAARLLRIILAEMPEPGLWVQYGHALKEAGFFLEAESAYMHAGSSWNRSQDYHLQLGHLQKISGRFALSQEHYVTARDFIDGEPNARNDAIRCMSALRGLIPPPSGEPDESLALFFSSASRLGSVLDRPPRASELGRAHYSYAYAMRGFQRAADQLGLDWTFLLAAHYVPDVSMLTASTRPVHVCFSPPAQARLLKGAYNILAFAWEFPALAPEENLFHAFSRPGAVLDLFDEIWTPSNFAVDVLKKYTSRKVSYVPSPIIPEKQRLKDHSQLGTLQRLEWVPLSIFPKLQSQFNEAARERARKLYEILDDGRSGRRENVYFTVFNPYDLRKQIGPLIEGFLRFQRKVPEAILLIKNVTPDHTNTTINSGIMEKQLSRPDELVGAFVSEAIWISSWVWTEEELNSLYSIASYYVCTSYCEGQNLPLLEAMSQGAIPISPRHTAMADYIDDQNAIVLKSEVAEVPALSGHYRLWGQPTNVITAEEVERAFHRSHALSAEARSELSRNAQRTVKEKFNSAILSQALATVEQKLSVEIEA